MAQTGQGEVAAVRFWLGLCATALGVFLFLRSAGLAHVLHWDHTLLAFQGIGITSGMVLAPLLVGLVLVFLDPQSAWPWIVVVASVMPFLVRVVIELRGRIWTFEPIELAVTLVLAVGGIGVFLSALRTSPASGTRGV